jgi:hypothetical protein
MRPNPRTCGAAPISTSAPPAIQHDHYYTYAELTTVVRELAAAYPELCELGSLGKSREGREIWLLTLCDKATGAAETKPAYLAYGNIHASEPTGVQCALHNAAAILAEVIRAVQYSLESGSVQSGVVSKG